MSLLTQFYPGPGGGGGGSTVVLPYTGTGGYYSIITSSNPGLNVTFSGNVPTETYGGGNSDVICGVKASQASATNLTMGGITTVSGSGTVTFTNWAVSNQSVSALVIGGSAGSPGLKKLYGGIWLRGIGSSLVGLTDLGNMAVSSAGFNGWGSSPNLANVSNIAFIANGNFGVNFNGCSLTSTSVDNILIAADACGQSLGNINLGGVPNAAPSAAGLAAKISLQGKGVTVTTN